MDQKETVEAKPIPPVAPVTAPARNFGIGTLLLVLLIVAGAGVVLRQEVLTQMASGFAQQQDTIRQLTQRVSALETQTASLAALPRPDTSVIEGMHTDLGTAQATLVQLNDRISVLEKKPTPAPAPVKADNAPVAKEPGESPLVELIKSSAPYETELSAWEKTHPGMGDRIKTLRANAATGLPSDDALRAQLLAAVGQVSAPPAPVENTGMLARINGHFGGLVSIKKQSAVPSTDLAVLQAMAPSAAFPALVQRVEQLPAAAKAPFAPWLDTVHARDAALAELTVLDSAP